jgi:hypothetical protein
MVALSHDRPIITSTVARRLKWLSAGKKEKKQEKSVTTMSGVSLC